MRSGAPGYRWRSKPPLGARLDPTNRFGSPGAYYLFNEGQGSPIDLVSVSQATLSGPVWAGGLGGRALSYSGNAAYYMTGAGGQSSGRFTVAVRCNMRTSGAGGFGNIWSVETGGVNGDLLNFQGSSTLFTLYINSVTVFSGVAVGIPLNSVADVVVTCDGAAASVYVNGVKTYSVATARLSIGGTAILGNRINHDSGVNGDYYFWGRWPFAFSAAQVASLFSDPYQMILPPAPRRMYSISKTAGGLSVAKPCISLASGRSIGSPGISF